MANNQTSVASNIYWKTSESFSLIFEITACRLYLLIIILILLPLKLLIIIDLYSTVRL